jgi:DNA replicative helicase MCM subunit Mcm2 (Cdc46/Mcm family)
MEVKLLDVEVLLDASTKKLQAAKESLIKLEQTQLALSDEQMDLCAEAKLAGAVGLLDKKREFDTAARGKNQELVQIALKITTATKAVASCEIQSKSLESQVHELRSEVGGITLKIDGLILDAQSIRPQMIFPKLLYVVEVLRFQTEAPCRSCHRFFVDMAAVPSSCGCLFHPICLWQMILAGVGECPRC